jgi:hypothetical protein
MKSPVQSPESQKPPSIFEVMTPLLSIGGWPGAIQVFTTPSQVPAQAASSSCCLPGFGIAGMLDMSGAAGADAGAESCATANSAGSARAVNSDSFLKLMEDLLCRISLSSVLLAD